MQNQPQLLQSENNWMHYMDILNTNSKTITKIIMTNRKTIVEVLHCAKHETNKFVLHLVVSGFILSPCMMYFGSLFSP
jgi:hypothetical protein